MKKILIALTLALLLLAQSCGQKEPEQTGKETVRLPEPPGVCPGTEWAFAPMDRQIPSDDPDFSVTGKDYEYRDGWLGTAGDGVFDLACAHEPGSEESFSFCFDYYAEGDGGLYIGLWLYGADSFPGDGMEGVWLRFGSGEIKDGEKVYKIDKGAVSVKVAADAAGGRLTVSVNGGKIIERACPPLNGGGAVKALSDKGPAYISNAAFRYGTGS